MISSAIKLWVQFVVAMTVLPFSLLAQQENEIDKWMKMGLEDIQNTRIVSVATGKKSMTIRESPGIISLITADDIENSGARDLIDVLRLVPGFEFGMDVDGVIGLGTRGMWGHEGKIMLLWDGQEFNDLLYANIPFGNHFPLDQIKRIEIIRGPGSSVYGGFAELAVINIISKGAESFTGFSLTARAGQMANSLGRRTISMSWGQKFGDVALNLAMYTGRSNKSDRLYMDVFGDSYEMKNSSAQDPFMLNLSFKLKNLHIKFLADSFHLSGRDHYDAIMPEVINNYFRSYFADIKYEFNLGKSLTLTPRLNYKLQYPWQMRDEFLKPEETYFDCRTSSLRGSLILSGDLSRNIYLNSGFQSYWDEAALMGDTAESWNFSESRSSNYSGLALFGQLFIKTPLVVISLGGRYDYHSVFGSSFVPWIGINKAFDKLYFKLLYGQTFRTPSFENINFSTDNTIKPEKSNEFDIEIGYQFNEQMIFSINAFDTNIDKPIIYNYDPISGEDTYQNYGQVGTRGLELEYSYRGDLFSATLNYSLYRVSQNSVTIYEVADNPNLLLGFPAHKVTLNANYRFNDSLNLNATGIFLSDRNGYGGVDDEDNLVLEKHEPLLLANVYLMYRNAFTAGLNFGIGLYDIANSGYRFIQPYAGGHAPLPGASREIMLNVSYHWDSLGSK